MKINKKIKWLAVVAGLTTLTTTITAPILVSCSSNDQSFKDMIPNRPDTGGNGGSGSTPDTGDNNGNSSNPDIGGSGGSGSNPGTGDNNDNINQPDTNNLIVDSFYSNDGSEFIVKINGKNLSNNFLDYFIDFSFSIYVDYNDMSLWNFNINSDCTEVTLSRFYEESLKSRRFDLYYKNELVTHFKSTENPNPPQIYENNDYVWNEFGLLIKHKRNEYNEDLVIPSELTAMGIKTKIKIIGESFHDSELVINSLTIPEGVEIISTRAFRFCFGSIPRDDVVVNIPSSVRIIGRYAFYNGFISQINFKGNSIKRLGEGAFSTNKLSGLLDLSNFEFEYLGEGAFEDNRITNFILNSKIDTIPARLFQNNELESIDLSHIKYIGDYAFYDNLISNVDFVNSPIKEIGEVAFRNNNLTEVTLWTSVKFARNTFDKKVKINQI